MIKGKKILEQFENLSSIEPSADWDENLRQKLGMRSHTGTRNYAGRMIFFAVAFLLLLNLFSLSKELLHVNRQLSSNRLKNIASELLISTNSSKF